MVNPRLRKRNNVEILGNADAAETLVFVHGFGTDRRAWGPVAAAFAHRCRIVLFDNVGAGDSDPAAFVQHRYLGLRAYAEDLLEICADLGLARACLVGHSSGAMIAALAALAGAQHFSRLVLVAASPRYLDDGDYVGGLSEQDLQAIYSAVLASFPEWAARIAPVAMRNPDRPELARHFAGTLASIRPDHALTVLCSILQSDHREDIARIDMPTLIVQTRDDLFVPPEVARYLHRHIRGSRLAEIDASGHLPHVAAPGQVAAAIRDFLDAQPRPGEARST